jgi:penicillin-binding protein 1C
MFKGILKRLKQLLSRRILYTAYGFIILAVLLFFAIPVSQDRLRGESSLRIFSKEGNLLRQFSSPQGDFAVWLSLNEFPESLKSLVLTAEDRRFYSHSGFDPAAIARAAWQDITGRKIISGGSTITQQLVKIAYKDVLPSNIYLKKITEIILALKVEIHNSKKTILECYLNRIPLRFNQKGIPSASRRIFGRDVRFLSIEESAALAVLIRENQPSREMFRLRVKNLLEKTGNAVSGIEPVQDKVFNAGVYSYTNEDSYTPHFEAFIKSLTVKVSGDIHTSISNNLNGKITSIINSELRFLTPYNVENCSVVVLKLPDDRNRKTELAAMVGSQNFRGKVSGQVNGCITVRSAGSSLKPFLYGYAMDILGYRPYTILNDFPLSLNTGENGTYTPKNNDLKFWGPIPLREALACSRNIPAVETADKIGVKEFYHFLEKTGFSNMDREPAYYGSGLALGTGGASLMQLCRGYAGIAGGGVVPVIYIGSVNGGDDIMYGKEQRIFSEQAAFRLTHILSDSEARRRAFGKRNFLDFPFDVAAKTGTSKDCRDAWTVGFTDKYVVGVWVGNFTGEEMNGVSGGWGAGRIFHQVVRLVSNRESPRFSYPDYFRKVRFCRITGKPAGPYCPVSLEFVDQAESFPGKCGSCTSGNSSEAFFYTVSDVPEILSPVNGESFITDPLIPAKNQSIPVKIVVNEKKGVSEKAFYYSIDNGDMKPVSKSIVKTFDLKIGRHVIQVYDNRDIIQSVEFTIE